MTHSWYEILHDFAGPFATVVAATVAAVITFHFGRVQSDIARTQAKISRQQAEVSSIRLQHDLYDRRYEIFTIAWDLLVREIIPSAQCSDEAFYRFVRGTAHAVFLVNEEVRQHLETLQKEALHLQRLRLRFNQTQPHTPERTKVVSEQQQLMDWFEAQLDVLIAKFKPLLGLDQFQLP